MLRTLSVISIYFFAFAMFGVQELDARGGGGGHGGGDFHDAGFEHDEGARDWNSGDENRAESNYQRYDDAHHVYNQNYNYRTSPSNTYNSYNYNHRGYGPYNNPANWRNGYWRNGVWYGPGYYAPLEGVQYINGTTTYPPANGNTNYYPNNGSGNGQNQPQQNQPQQNQPQLNQNQPQH